MNDSTTTETTRDAAADAVKHGYVVLPLWPNKKVPHASRKHPDGSILGEDFTMAEVGTTDVAVIDDWWAREPSAGIGVVTGSRSRLLVIDIDQHGDIDGESAWDQFELHCLVEGYELPQTRVHATPSGGMHLLYTLPPDVIVPKIVGFLPGVDIIGDGGWVGWPPTAVDGHAYRLQVAADVAPAPEWFVARVRSRGRSSTGSGSGSAIGESSIVGVTTADLLAGVPEGQRHNRIAAAVGRWWNQLGDIDAVRVLALSMARSCDPSHDESDVLQVVEDITAKPRGGVDPDLEAWARADRTTPDEVYPVVTLRDLLDRPAQAWRDEQELFPVGGRMVAVVGHRGSGKSMLMTALGWSLGTGRDWLGIPVQPARPLYVPLEGSYTVAPRARDWAHENGLSVENLIAAMPFVEVTRLGLARDVGQRMVNTVRAGGHDVVFFDAWRHVLEGGSDRKPEDVVPMLAALRRICAETDATLVVLQNTGWEARHRSRGLTEFEDDMDVIYVTTKRPGRFELRQTKNRLSVEREDTLHWRIGSGVPVGVTSDVRELPPDLRTVTDAIWAFLQDEIDVDDVEAWSRSQVTRETHASILGSQSQRTEAIKRLLRADLVREHEATKLDKRGVPHRYTRLVPIVGREGAFLELLNDLDREDD